MAEPSYRRTRTEAVVAMLLWLGAALWVIPVSYWLGYQRPVHSIGGIPNWVLWGVLVPWVVVFFAHVWYSLVFLRDDGPEASGPRPSQPTQHGPGG